MIAAVARRPRRPVTLLAAAAVALGVALLQVPARAGCDPLVGGTCVGATVSPSSGVWGTEFDVAGLLTCGGVPVSGQVLDLEVKPVGAAGFTKLGGASGATDAEGRKVFSHVPDRNTSYRVAYAGGVVCTAGTSPTVSVLVRPGVTFAVAANGAPRSGQAVVFSGSVKPAHAGQSVILQVYQSGAWRNSTSARLDSASRAVVSYAKTGTGGLLFRLAYPTQHADHAWNVSRAVRVTWT